MPAMPSQKEMAANKARIQSLSAHKVVLEGRIQKAKILTQKVESLFTAANELGDPQVARAVSALLTAVKHTEQALQMSLNEVNKERQSFGLR